MCNDYALKQGWASPVQCEEYAIQQKYRSCTFRKDHDIKGGWEDTAQCAKITALKRGWKCLIQCRKERILKKGYDIFLKVIQRTLVYPTLVEGITAFVNYRKHIKEKN